MAHVHHLGRGQVVGVRLMHLDGFSPDLEDEMVVRALLHMADVPGERDDIVPSEIVGDRVVEH